MAIKIDGNWKKGFSLDLHTESSEFLGVDPSGHDRFKTKRTEVGELVYLLKYQSDLSVLPEIASAVLKRLRGVEKMDYLVAVPPSNIARPHQPVFLVGQELEKATKVPFLKDAILKSKPTPQLKSITDPDERERVLADAFTINMNYDLSGCRVLVIDDLYRSGATLRAVTSVLCGAGKVADVFVLTLTKTRSNR